MSKYSLESRVNKLERNLGDDTDKPTPAEKDALLGSRSDAERTAYLIASIWGLEGVCEDLFRALRETPETLDPDEQAKYLRMLRENPDLTQTLMEEWKEYITAHPEVGRRYPHITQELYKLANPDKEG